LLHKTQPQMMYETIVELFGRDMLLARSTPGEPLCVPPEH